VIVVERHRLRAEFLGFESRVNPVITSPPDSEIACPLMDRDSGRQSQATVAATSSGETRRRCGLRRSSMSRASAGDRPVVSTMLWIASSTIAVSVYPGHTALTVMLVRATSSASARVKPMTPCLAAQYAATFG
jgi:hypothetical protein